MPGLVRRWTDWRRVIKPLPAALASPSPFGGALDRTVHDLLGSFLCCSHFVPRCSVPPLAGGVSLAMESCPT